MYLQEYINYLVGTEVGTKVGAVVGLAVGLAVGLGVGFLTGAAASPLMNGNLVVKKWQRIKSGQHVLVERNSKKCNGTKTNWV